MNPELINLKLKADELVITIKNRVARRIDGDIELARLNKAQAEVADEIKRLEALEEPAKK